MSKYGEEKRLGERMHLAKFNYYLRDYGKTVPDDRIFVTNVFPCDGSNQVKWEDKETHQMHAIEATQLPSDTPTSFIGK